MPNMISTSDVQYYCDFNNIEFPKIYSYTLDVLQELSKAQKQFSINLYFQNCSTLWKILSNVYDFVILVGKHLDIKPSSFDYYTESLDTLVNDKILVFDVKNDITQYNTLALGYPVQGVIYS